MADRGPVETAINSPGFRSFWEQLQDNLTTMREKLVREAMGHIREGDNAKAISFLARAAAVDDIITRTVKAPVRAVDQEKEQRNGRPAESAAGFGYTGVS